MPRSLVSLPIAQDDEIALQAVAENLLSDHLQFAILSLLKSNALRPTLLWLDLQQARLKLEPREQLALLTDTQLDHWKGLLGDVVSGRLILPAQLVRAPPPASLDMNFLTSHQSYEIPRLLSAVQLS